MQTALRALVITDCIIAGSEEATPGCFADHLTQLRHLTRLQLKSNYSSGDASPILEACGQMPRLAAVQLLNNTFSAVNSPEDSEYYSDDDTELRPAQVSSMPALKRLAIHGEQFLCIQVTMRGFGKLTALQQLSLRGLSLTRRSCTH
jgi:hypothetical protein